VAGGQWLTPVILATWEAEIGRISVLWSPGGPLQGLLSSLGLGISS
jgi:hypothetical protein